MAGNLEVTDLPLIPAVDGADVYAAKNNLDYRVRTGEAGGLATLDGTGKINTSQLPAGIWVTKTGDTMTGKLIIDGNIASGHLSLRNNSSSNVLDFGIGITNAADPNSFIANRTATGNITFYTGAAQRAVIDNNGMSVTGNFSATGNVAAQTVFANTNFTSTSTNVVLAGTGSGGVFLRPNGAGNATAQVVLQTSGMNVNTSMAVYTTAATGSQQVITSYGYNNGVPRWKNVIEASGAWSYYAYDTGGGSPTAVLTMYSPVAGGGPRIVGQGVYESAGTGGGLQFNDRTSARSWMWYGQADVARLFNGSGDITTVSTGGVWTSANFVATSDKTLKTEIADKPARRDLADKLRLVSFIWKADGRKDQGLIAQEVREIAPEYVYEQDGILSIDKTNLLLECVVDLANRVRELEGR